MDEERQRALKLLAECKKRESKMKLRVVRINEKTIILTSKKGINQKREEFLAKIAKQDYERRHRT